MYPGETPGETDIFQHHDGTGGGMNIWQHLGEEAVQMIRSPNGGMNGGIYPDGVRYPPDAVTENALHWIDSTSAPFLVRLSLLQPHTPVLPPAKYVKLLDGQDPGLPSFDLGSDDGIAALNALLADLLKQRPSEAAASP